MGEQAFLPLPLDLRHVVFHGRPPKDQLEQSPRTQKEVDCVVGGDSPREVRRSHRSLLERPLFVLEFWEGFAQPRGSPLLRQAQQLAPKLHASRPMEQ
ncbi:hypothetical protein ACFX2B_013142 [Malus domestica]